MSKPLAVDLFSGCGGVSEGLRQAGFQIVAAVEIDRLAAETYAENHPKTHLFQQNILDLKPAQLLRSISVDRGEVGLLAACAPCQGFSRLRTLNRSGAADDTRNNLVLRVLPFVSALLPRALMLENVPDARLSHQMAFVVDRLRRSGYHFREQVLDVADYGVPQHRRRYILVGMHERTPEIPLKDRRRHTVREAIAHLPPPGESGDALHDVSAQHSRRITQLIANIPKDGGSRNALPRDRQLACHRLCNGFSDVYGRMSWDKPSPTITSGFVNPSKGRFLHPVQDRAITPREAALLQGFPPAYFFSMKRGKYGAAQLIGNAVPPEFARRQAMMLRV